jgi:cytochrome P450
MPTLIAPSAHLKRELPPAVPLPAALQTLACRWWPLAYFERCRTRYGRRFTVYPVDMPPLVFLSHPEDIHAVLAASPSVLHAGAGAAVLAPLIGARSFMLCEEEEHRHGRRAVMPVFHARVLESHAAALADAVEREVATWPLGAAVALHPRLRALTLRVILGAVLAEGDAVQAALHERLAPALAVTASLVLQAPRVRGLPGWRATWRRFQERRAACDELLYTLIRARRAGSEHPARGEGEHRGDLLDALLAARNPDGAAMSDGQVRDNLVSAIVSGHETTAAELAWALQLLAHHPPVQERLRAELDGGAGEAYLEATIDETLRHRPVFPFLIPRAVVEPVEIGGFLYRPPAHLLGCTYLMHHDPALYPDPHVFRPERFLGGAPRARTWLPWGAGPRSCVGRHLALAEMRAVLRAVLARRLVLPAGEPPERERWRSAILVPHAGGRVVLRPRHSLVRRPRRARKTAHIPV